MELITTDELVDQITDKVLERLAEPVEEADDFADVMRNGLGAIVAWFNEDAGNAEPEEVERYSLCLGLVILDDGTGEAAVYNEGKYLGDVDLTPDEVAALFPWG